MLASANRRRVWSTSVARRRPRCPTETTPSSFSVSCVRLGRTVSSISFSRNARLILRAAQAPQPDHNVHDGAPTHGCHIMVLPRGGVSTRSRGNRHFTSRWRADGPARPFRYLRARCRRSKNCRRAQSRHAPAITGRAATAMAGPPISCHGRRKARRPVGVVWSCCSSECDSEAATATERATTSGRVRTT
jgi:hypothetical protein